MAVAGPSLLLLLVLGGMVLGGLALLVGLVVNKQTRPFGIALLGAGALMVVMVVGWTTASRRVDRQIHAVSVSADAAAHQQIAHELGHHSELSPVDAAAFRVSGPTRLRLGSWAAIGMLIIGVGFAYAVMKGLNNKHGRRSLFALGGAGLAAAAVVLTLVARASELRESARRAEAVAIAQNQAAMSAAEAWDELTRPRIQLEGPTDKIAIRGPSMTVYVSKEDSNERLADHIRMQQAVLGAGEELTVNIGGQTFTARGRTSRDVILRRIDEARAKHADSVAHDAVPAADATLLVVVNGQELKFEPGASTSEIAKRVIEAGGTEADRVEVKMNGATMRFSPGSPVGAVENLVEAARPSTPAAASESHGESVVGTAAAAAEPEAMPTWVDQPDSRLGEVYRQVITTEPFVTADECYADFMVKLREATNKFAEEHLNFYGDAVAASGLAPGELASAVSVDEHLETYQSSAGPMKRLHVRVEFDEDFKDQLKRAFTLRKRAGALDSLTLVGGLVLLLVGGVLGLLKLDEATKGYYSKRLFIGVPAVIIGLLLLFVTLDAVGVRF